MKEKTILRLRTGLIFLIPLFFVQCSKQGPGSGNTPSINSPLGQVKKWMYQLQALEDTNSLDLLAKSDFELLVLEPGDDLKNSPYNTREIVRRLRYTPDGRKRWLIAYIDIGEAEDYRSYWSAWTAPTASSSGSPGFLITTDPGGWKGNYPVAFWDTTWKAIWTGVNGRIDQLMNLGFDGVYLDWVEAYSNPEIRKAALQQGVIPEREMMDFIEQIRKKGKNNNSGFLVIVQNAPYLIEYNATRYTQLIDAIAVEDTWFYGVAGVDWNSPRAGDLPNKYAGESSTESLLKQYKKYLNQNIPVFSIDYCVNPDNARFVYGEARKNGLIPLVTRISLSKITAIPPY
jgi:cysteinyl-tRNA synthetase